MLNRIFGVIGFLTIALIAQAQINAFDKGFDAFQREKYDNAVHFYTVYIEDHKSPNAYFNRGLAYYKLGEHDKAVEDYTNVLRLEEDDYEALYNRGLSYFDAGEINNAISDYEAVLTLNLNYHMAHTGLGLSYSQNEDYKKAIEHFTQAINLKGDSQVNYYNRGLAYHALEDLENAELDYSHAIHADESIIDPYISRANLNHELGHFDLSVLDYTDAVNLSPESPSLYYNRGISYYDNKEFKEAIDDFNEVLLYDSSHIDALWYLALASKEMGNEDQAIIFYDRVAQLNPEYEHLWSMDKNRLVLKKFIRENWIYAIAIIVLLLASLFFVLRIVKTNRSTEID